MKYYVTYFGQLYGEGLYGDGTYSCSATQQANGTCSSATAGSTNGNNNLTDTGIAVVGFVTLACLIIFVSLVVRIWRRRKTTAKWPVAKGTDPSERPSLKG